MERKFRFNSGMQFQEKKDLFQVRPDRNFWQFRYQMFEIAPGQPKSWTPLFGIMHREKTIRVKVMEEQGKPTKQASPIWTLQICS